jgi:hypothetical protein
MVAETWNPIPDDKTVPAGSAFTRTIHMEADDLPGMVLPSFRFDPPEGLQLYSQPPVVNDQSNRGALTGNRSETMTFVCEQAGNNALPALVVSWWNPSEQKLSRIELPERKWTVTAPPQAPATPTPGEIVSTKDRGVKMVLSFLALLGIGLACWHFGPGIARTWRSIRHRILDSEPARFRALIKACRTGDAHTAYRALLAWQQCISTSSDCCTQSASANPKPTNDLSHEILALESAAFSPRHQSPNWSPVNLIINLKQHRSRWKWRLRETHNGCHHTLGSLNP